MSLSFSVTYSKLDDKSLLHGLNNGDDAAFTEIYNRYWKTLFVIASNKLGDLTEAEELVQDIFLDLWNRRETIVVHSSLSAYLAVSVKYKVFDQLAKKAQHLRYQQHAARFISVTDSSTEQMLHCQEIKERMFKSVAELPEKCKLVFELSRNNGFTQKEIAARMGIAEKTVEAHLSKALRAIRIGLGSLLTFILLFTRI